MVFIENQDHFISIANLPNDLIMITGFGRTGAMFAAQTFGVIPDIICGGKGISRGAIPMGTMITRESMAEAFLGRPEDNLHFVHGHTFTENPLAAAGIAVLDEIVEKKLDKRAGVFGQFAR